MLKSGSVRRKRGAMTTALIIRLVRYADHILTLTPDELTMERYRVSDAILELNYKRSLADSTSDDLLAFEEGKKAFLKDDQREVMIEKSRMLIEVNRRMSTAIACFTFMLVGIPLGVKSHRKETSIGMVMSLAIVFVYYILIVTAKALADFPEFHPNLILWLPMVGTQLFGFWMIRRSS